MGPIVHCHSVGGMESEAQYAPRNAEIQPGPDYANTSTNMGEGFEGAGAGWGIFGSFGRREVATPEGETDDDEKKVPNIENEKKRERREKFPFCLSSFAAFTPPRPPSLPQSFSLARGPLSSFSSLPLSFFVVAAKKNGASHALTSSSPDMRKMAQNQSLNFESIG